MQNLQFCSIHKFAAIALLIWYLASAVGHCEPNLKREPGSIDDRVTHGEIRQLTTNRHSNGLIFTVAILGKSRSGRSIEAVEVTSSSAPPANTVVYICRQHGHEPASTSGAMQFLRALADAPVESETVGELSKVRLIVVPVANPDGARSYLRHNSHNVDLNRDWLDRKEPETRALWHLIQQCHATIVADQHELFPDDTRNDFTEAVMAGSGASTAVISKSARLQASVAASMQAAGYPIVQHWIDDKHPARLLHRYAGVVLQIPSILFETNRQTGTGRSLAERARAQQIFMESVLRFAADGGPTMPVGSDHASTMKQTKDGSGDKN